MTLTRFNYLPKFLLLVLIIFLLLVTYLWLQNENQLHELWDAHYLRTTIESFGILGPGLIISLMIIAIVLSPLPSAPIALASGAAYGHTEGTIYIVLGSEIGAIIAFGLARYLGKDYLHEKFGDHLTKGLLGSQHYLMGVVFVSRLMPFISFDMMSYAAGLSNLSFIRFAIATLAGIIPASFVLAHFGSELATDTQNSILPFVLLLGAVALIPIGIQRYFRDK